MAHELNFFNNGRARLAYVGATPWHGLGQQLTEGQPLDVWAREAGMDFQILEAPVAFRTHNDRTFAYDGKKVLYRSDTEQPLSVVGSRYNVVQPRDVLEFFKNLTEGFGFQLETAGVLFQGQKYWALARVGHEAKLRGGDTIRNYVMFATSCDGTMRTMAKQTDIRVVCNNTITIAANGKTQEVRISHASKYEAEQVQAELGLIDASWTEHVALVKELTKVSLSDKQAVDFTIKMVGDPEKPVDAQPHANEISRVLQLYKGRAKGAELESAKDTAWGLVNAFTEVDTWHKGSSQERRLENTWFFSGDKFKQRVFSEAVNDFVMAAAA